MTLRVVLYAPHYGALGGGERVFEALVDAAAPVATSIRLLVAELPEFALRSRLGFRDLPFELATPDEVTLATLDADLFLTVVNGFPVLSHAAHNVAVIQFPMDSLSENAQTREAQLRHLDGVTLLAYSSFVAEWIRRRWNREPIVIAPPLRLGPGGSAKRPKTIAAVGRFFRGEHEKRQDVLVEAFRHLNEQDPGWTLRLLGAGVDETARHYIEELQRAAGDLPIELVVNPTIDEIDECLDETSVFWHASGFGRDPLHPERAEHFGMATVEAMSRGAIPIVFDDGGQSEIVTDDVGWRWRSIDDLVHRTIAVHTADDGLDGDGHIAAMRRAAERRAATLASPSFTDSVGTVLNRLVGHSGRTLAASLPSVSAAPCLSVVIPCYNEIATIDAILDRVLSSPYVAEVIVVDDGSTDGTRNALAARALEPRLEVLLQAKNSGKGAALRRGFASAAGPYVVVQDADLEYDPADYGVLLEPLIAGDADVVFGSRFLSGRPHRVLYFWHSLGNKVLTLVSNMFTNLNLTDMETCYKMFRIEVLRSIQLEENRFGIEPELTAKIARQNWRIYEVGISYSGRTYAEGKKIGWKDGLRAFYCIIRYSVLGTRMHLPTLST